MPENFKEKIKEKMHIIFIVVMVVYLSALTIKTGQVYWEEFHKQGIPEHVEVQAP